MAHAYTVIHSSTNNIVRFADDTSIVGLISDNDQTHQREEVIMITKNFESDVCTAVRTDGRGAVLVPNTQPHLYSFPQI